MLSTGKENTIGDRQVSSKPSERQSVSSSRQGHGEAFFYKVYGLTIQSELELPELVDVEPEEPEVRIRFGEFPERLDGLIAHWQGFMASPSAFILSVDGVARYHINDGRMITIAPELDAERSGSRRDIRLWLLGWAFGVLLHQRGSLPLHVSAVKAPNGVWAFTGGSGEGKSTVAGFLHQRFGHVLVTDDVAVVDLLSSGAVLFPGPRKLRLCVDALNYLGLNGTELKRDSSCTDKFQLDLNREKGQLAVTLDCLVQLETVDDGVTATMERLQGIEAFNVCRDAVYRPLVAACFRQPHETMETLANLCRKVPIYRLRRPRGFEVFEQSLEALSDLMNDFRSES